MTTLLMHLPQLASPAALLGLFGLILGITWPMLRGRGAMLALQATSAGLFAAHFALLGSATGAVTCCVAIVQSAAAWRIRQYRHLVAIYGTTLLVVAATAWETWRGVPSLCAAMGSLFATMGRLEAAPRRMRLWFLGCTCAWIGHNALVGSVFGLASDALTVAALAVGIYRETRAVQATAPAPALGASAAA
jgi:Bacterial inner membrane protein